MSHLKKELIIISNLRDSYPRIPAFSYFLAKKKWKVTIISPFMNKTELSDIGLPKDFLKFVNLHFTDTYFDIYEPIRKIYNKFKPTKTKKTSNSILPKESSIYKFMPIFFLKFLLKCYKSIFAFPDTEKKWLKIALPIVENKIRENSNPIILSSSPYPISHVIAYKLILKYKFRWIADFRDPWSLNHNDNMFFVRKLADKIYEKKIINLSNLIFVPSRGVKDKLKTLHNKKIEIIPNGYFPIMETNFKKKEKKNYLEIVYTGKLYEGKQKVDAFLAALKCIKEKNNFIYKGLRVNFYGEFSFFLDKKIKKLGLNEIVFQKGKRKRHEILNIQQNTDILILFNWNEFEKGIFPLKLYEYLFSKNLILTIGKDHSGEINNILFKTKMGYNLIDKNQIYKKIVYLYNQFNMNNSISPKGIIKEIEKFTYEYNVPKLEKCFMNILNK